MSVRVALSATLILGSLAPAGAQLVTPKTVPIRQENQFAIFPTLRAGMADVGIALDDTLLDPWVNPAKVTSVRGSSVYVLPFTHAISSGSGGGTTLPVGGYAKLGAWTGGTVLAFQQINLGDAGRGTRDETARNQYASVVVGRRLDGGLSIGGSAYVAGLDAVDAVDLLYRGSDRLRQSGGLADFRLGATKVWGPRRLEAVVLHNRTNMAQDVHYPSRTLFTPTSTVPIPARDEHNIDKTIIWGAHTQYVQAVGDSGFRIGFIGTANHLSHPKIPNYQIQNIPRDPGSTWGFNVGIGIARTSETTSIGVDFIQEPMISNTWGVADRDTATSSGGVLRAGERTVDNHFKFSNRRFRVGVGHDFIHTDSGSAFGVQYGLSMYSINYRLHQVNHVQGDERWAFEGWTEWTPTVGLRWQTRDFEFLYNMRLSCGPSECSPFSGDKITVPGVSTGGVIAAPTSLLNFNGGYAYTHRFQLKVPVR